METQSKSNRDDLPLRQHGRMADIMTSILTTGDADAKAPILSCKSAEPSSPVASTKAQPKRKVQLQEEDSDDDSPDEKDAKKDSSVVKNCHVLPGAASLDQERKLQRIATRGVVELFNAVNKQQKEIEAKLDEAGGSERKKAKVLSTVNKGNFISLLKGNKKKSQQIGSQKQQEGEMHDDDGDDDGGDDGGDDDDDGGHGDDDDDSKPSWNVLQKDYMMGSKLRDWDKSQDKALLCDEEEHDSSVESE